MLLKRPYPRGENVRSPWGMRIHPISGKRKHHRGQDIAYHGPIYAPADGTVVHKGADLNKRTGGGYVLILRHENPRVWTVYYHMREPSHLLKGTRVKCGEVIGYTGTTGASTGVHLHWETRRSRQWGTDFDPATMTGTEYASEHKKRLEVSSDGDTRERNVPAQPSRRSLLNRVSPGLASWHNGWMKRGEMWRNQ